MCGASEAIIHQQATVKDVDIPFPIGKGELVFQGIV